MSQSELPDNIPGLIAVAMVAIFGAYFLIILSGSLPMANVNPQAQAVASNAVNTGVTVLSIDPTLLLGVVALIVGSLVAAAWKHASNESRPSWDAA